MKVVIIEDEILAAKKLEELILRYNSEFHILAKIRSVQEAIQWFGTNDGPDLVYMDIHLLDGTSFEIIKQVNLSCPVIFTTAYDDYALEAFKVHSIDYLLKPVSYPKLQRAMDKLGQIQRNLEDIKSTRLKQALDLLESGNTSYKSRFLVRTGSKLLSINTQDIGLFYSEDKITFLITLQKERFMIGQTLEELEKLLDPQFFFRVNRQVILHINSIKAAHKYYKGRLKIELLQGLSPLDIVVSSRRVSGFQDWLDN